MYWISPIFWFLGIPVEGERAMKESTTLVLHEAKQTMMQWCCSEELCPLLLMTWCKATAKQQHAVLAPQG
jgi:hypothetical protein